MHVHDRLPLRSGRPHDRLDDARMRATTAEIVGERVLDLSFGRLFGRRQECGRLHDHAVDAVAALHRLLIDEGALHGVESPSSVTTFCCAVSEDSGVTHERTALPSMCTVQAPHCASPQPKRGPCSARLSRSAYRSGISGSSMLIWTGLPLTLSDFR